MSSRGAGDRSRLTSDEIRRLHEEGMTLQAIAALAGVSRQAVWGRLRRLTRKPPPGLPKPSPAELRAMGPEAPLWSWQPVLSARAFHTLLLLLGDLRAPVAAVKGLTPLEILRTPDCGPKTYREICEAFGLELDAQTMKRAL